MTAPDYEVTCSKEIDFIIKLQGCPARLHLAHQKNGYVNSRSFRFHQKLSKTWPVVGPFKASNAIFTCLNHDYIQELDRAVDNGLGYAYRLKYLPRKFLVLWKFVGHK